MSVNLVKNKDTLLAAWKDVVNTKTTTNWAVFGYEGTTNDLKVISTGSDGIEEMVEDLNSGKIMYAFLQVLDPKTSLPKNVLINWQGEGAQRKGTCANHFRDITNFFKGAHVTIHARNEEEVDPQLIIDTVSKSTGSVYSFRERTEHTSTGPVGTVYQRVIPKQEINAQERDKFWEKEEQEEKARQETERRRKEEERRKLEEERHKREVEEASVREAKIKERSNSIKQIRDAERNVNSKVDVPRDSSLLEDTEKEERERKERAEILRRQRSQEAKQLIATRTIDARAVFEKNTSVGQLNTRRASYQPNGHPTEEKQQDPLPDVTMNQRKSSLPTSVVPTYIEKQKAEEKPTYQHSNGSSNQVEENNVIREEQEWEDDARHDIQPTVASVADELINPVVDDVKSSFENELINGEYGLTARALYDYQAADATEITFDPGDIITHIDQIDEGWWQGLGPDGVFGLFPANYVELIN